MSSAETQGLMAPRELIIEADGGSRGNPGVAGYGALVRDGASGRVLAERAAPLGQASNNVAEYNALVAGLDAVLEIAAGGPVALTVRMDSKLVIEQMRGTWKIKHEDMRRLAMSAQERCRAIRAAGGRIEFTWVPRERNRDADRLSNLGMDGRTVNTTSTDHQTESVPVEEQIIAASPAPDLSGGVRIFLVRHGVTDYTVTGRLDGRGGANPPLNDDGLRMADQVAAALAGDIAAAEADEVHVVTSGLQRAKQTGAAIARALGIPEQDMIEDVDFDEQAFGAADGMTLAEVSATSPAKAWRWREDPKFAFQDGESHEQQAARVIPALQRAAALGGNVVIVSHRKTIMCILQWILDVPYDKMWRLAAAPCSVTSIELWADGGASVGYTNDTRHLR